MHGDQQAYDLKLWLIELTSPSHANFGHGFFLLMEADDKTLSFSSIPVMLFIFRRNVPNNAQPLAVEPGPESDLGIGTITRLEFQLRAPK